MTDLVPRTRLSWAGSRLVVLGVVAAGTLFGLAAPPVFADSSQPIITHPGDDFAGSQIARHEGRRDVQDIPLDPLGPAGSVPGMDVSGHQGAVDWGTAARNGAQFAYVKATEGITYTNPYFGQQYNGSLAAGAVRGAYHFALPNVSSGVDQANYFVDHGGSWSRDGRTLPPAVDLEYNPYGDACYGMPPPALVGWVHAFVDQLRARTSRFPMIYTSTNWWSRCTGNDGGFGADPLWIARYSTSIGALPAGWGAQAIWQFADAGPFPGDQDAFNGDGNQLRALAYG